MSGATTLIVRLWMTGVVISTSAVCPAALICRVPAEPGVLDPGMSLVVTEPVAQPVTSVR